MSPKEFALALRGRLSRDEQATLQQKPTQNLAAYDFYLRGWALYQLYRQEDNEKAIDLFKQAMGLDPKFALAYADQAERDHAALKAAVRTGVIEAQPER